MRLIWLSIIQDFKTIPEDRIRWHLAEYPLESLRPEWEATFTRAAVHFRAIAIKAAQALKEDKAAGSLLPESIMSIEDPFSRWCEALRYVFPDCVKPEHGEMTDRNGTAYRWVAGTLKNGIVYSINLAQKLVDAHGNGQEDRAVLDEQSPAADKSDSLPQKALEVGIPRETFSSAEEPEAEAGRGSVERSHGPGRPKDDGLATIAEYLSRNGITEPRHLSNKTKIRKAYTEMDYDGIRVRGGAGKWLALLDKPELKDEAKHVKDALRQYLKRNPNTS